MSAAVAENIRFTVIDARLCSCGYTIYQVAWRDGTVDQLHLGRIPASLTLNKAERDALLAWHVRLVEIREND